MLRKVKGFTLIELMIVVAIIGIMAAIAIPNFLNYMCKSKQTEAKQGLGAIATNEESWKAEATNDSYTTSTSNVGFAPKGTPRYSYFFASAADTESFAAESSSSSVRGTNTDYWTINQARALGNTTNGCI